MQHQQHFENSSIQNGFIKVKKDKESIIKIYKEWANHYLQRYYSKQNILYENKRYIEDITSDLKDGVLLLDIIECVSSTRIISPKITRKPTNVDQMLQNIDVCLNHLKNLKINVDGILTSDIYTGNLKSILNLFYNLSRFKGTAKPSTKQCDEQSCLTYKSNPTQITASNRCMKAPNVHTNTGVVGNGSIVAPSRLPQKSESRIPGPHQQQTAPVTAVNKKLQAFIPKAMNRPSSRSNSPSSISKCSSNSQSSLNPCQTNNSQSESKGIRPPRPSSIPTAPNVTHTTPANAAKSVQSKLNPPKSIAVQNQIKRNNLIVNEEDEKHNPSVKANVAKANSNSFGFNCTRSESVASLSEAESSCSSNLKPPPNRQLPAKIRSGGIPAPKSRPTSACFENSNSLTEKTNANGYSTLRPLSSSSGLQKIGLTTVREDSFSKDEEKSCSSEKSGQRESHLNAPLKSESNVARVSPIRRQPEFTTKNSSETQQQTSAEAEEMQSITINCKKNEETHTSEPQETKCSAFVVSSLTSTQNQMDCRSQLKLLLDTNYTSKQSRSAHSSQSSEVSTSSTIKNETNNKPSHCRIIDDAAYSDSECIRKQVKLKHSTNSLTTKPDPLANRYAKSRPFNPELQFRAGIKRKEGSSNGDHRSLVTPSPTPSCFQNKRLSRNGELRESTSSLLSLSSSYSNQTDDKHYQEIKKLKNELMRSNEKVATLSIQLATNAQMIVAFEQSLASMTARLHQYSVSSEQKDREINRLKSTIDALRKECQIDYSPTLYSESDSENRRKKVKEQKSNGVEKEEHSPGWFRGSISRAFKKNRARHKSGGSISDAEGCHSGTDCSSIPSTPLLSPRNPINSEIVEEFDIETIRELKKQLLEKDRLLTDIRLEALSTSHQIENFKETITKLRAETLLLREENQRFKRNENRESIASSICSLTSFSDSSVFGGHDKLLIIYLNKIKLGMVSVSLSTSWNQIDNFVHQCFQEYLEKLDPSSTLEVNRDTIKSYSVGNKTRELPAYHTSESPFSWISGNNELRIKLIDEMDEIVIHSLVPKPIFAKIISLTKDKKRLVICGPQGCGKSYTGYCLGEYLVKTQQFDTKEDVNSSIAIFTIKANCDDELKSFLTNVAESCESKQFPKVIILNDIENIANVCDAFAPFRTIDPSKGPFIVATMRETSQVTTSLQLHFNFRVVVWTANMEPCKGFLSRCLRKKFFLQEMECRIKKGVSVDRNFLKTLDWIAELCNRLNRSVHKNCVNNLYFGSNLFITCPINEKQSQDWFHSLWNNYINCHLNQMFANKNRSLEELQKWIQESYPWKVKQSLETMFTRKEVTETESDPLLKTLLKLKEAI